MFCGTGTKLVGAGTVMATSSTSLLISQLLEYPWLQHSAFSIRVKACRVSSGREGFCTSVQPHSDLAPSSCGLSEGSIMCRSWKHSPWDKQKPFSNTVLKPIFFFLIYSMLYLEHKKTPTVIPKPAIYAPAIMIQYLYLYIRINLHLQINILISKNKINVR